MAAGIVGAMLAAKLGCIGWQRLHDARLTARILAGGFVPWAGGEGGADHLYWLQQPGRLLHIVGRTFAAPDQATALLKLGRRR